MTAKEEILARIRSATWTADIDVPRDYIQEDSLDPAERIELFRDRLRDYDCEVHFTTVELLPQTIARVLTGRGIERVGVPGGFPATWLPAGIEFVDGVPGDCVVTTCTAAVALTGTIVLQHGEAEGNRAFTLLPDYHLCLVRAGQIVGTLPEALKLLNPLLPTTTISGPSATSDIEMTRIRGVHGPRTLEIVIVS